MRNPFGMLLLIMTIMVSAMSLYINLGLMLYSAPLFLMNRLASVMFLLAWLALAGYSFTHNGVYSVFMSLYWLSAFAGAAFCVITTSGLTSILEFAAYFLLLPLTPLFGLRLDGMSHFAWAIMLAGISLSYASAAVAATYRREAA